jgi:hypothetical protein
MPEYCFGIICVFFIDHFLHL